MDIKMEDMAKDDLPPEECPSSKLRSVVEINQRLLFQAGEVAPTSVEQLASSLKFDLEISSLMHLVREVKYIGFLRNLEVCNGTLKPDTRGAVELLWERLVTQQKEKSRALSQSEKMKDYHYEVAMGQCNWDATEQFWMQRKILERARLQAHGNEKEWKSMTDGTMAEEELILKVPKSKDFLKSTRGMGYRAFLNHLVNYNQREITRGVAEAEWHKFVTKLFSTWVPLEGFETREEMEAELRVALDQINGCKNFDPKTYWACDDANSLRTPSLLLEAAVKRERRDFRKKTRHLPEVKAARIEKTARRRENREAKPVDPKKANMNANKKVMDGLESLVSDLGF